MGRNLSQSLKKLILFLHSTVLSTFLYQFFFVVRAGYAGDVSSVEKFISAGALIVTLQNFAKLMTRAECDRFTLVV